MLLTSIRDDNPVIFVEHRLSHFQTGHVPAEQYTVPLGRSRVLAAGSDVTLVGISHAAVECLRARESLQAVGVSAEVIDPVSLSPLDVEGIAASVRRTGRLLVVDTAWTFCGASAEIITAVAEHLETPFRFRRLGFAPVVCPTSKPLENLYYPNAATIASAAFALVDSQQQSWRPEHVDAPEILEFKGPF
jgi:pyruvate/2-oxoglutarate/acetoin dehydrogenase E1 component